MLLLKGKLKIDIANRLLKVLEHGSNLDEFLVNIAGSNQAIALCNRVLFGIEGEKSPISDGVIPHYFIINGALDQ